MEFMTYFNFFAFIFKQILGVAYIIFLTMYVIGKIIECLTTEVKPKKVEENSTEHTAESSVLDASQEPEIPTETFEVVKIADPRNSDLMKNLISSGDFVDHTLSIAASDLKDPFELEFFKVRKAIMEELCTQLYQLKTSTEKLNNLTGITCDSQFEKLSCLTRKAGLAYQRMNRVEAEYTSNLAAEMEIGDDWEMVV